MFSSLRAAAASAACQSTRLHYSVDKEGILRKCVNAGIRLKEAANTAMPAIMQELGAERAD
ncbi:hypothetical protein D3C85_1719420 [compost metagenome]